MLIITEFNNAAQTTVAGTSEKQKDRHFLALLTLKRQEIKAR